MKKVLAVMLLCVACVALNAVSWKDAGAVPSPAKYESFENGIPETWQLQGRGKLSISPWHYKLGKKSLQWDFVAGDKIKVNNTIGDPNRRGGRNNACFACFGVWVYVKKAMAGKSLRFEFYSGAKKDAYFDFPLNFKGWQCAFVRYNTHTYLKGNVSVRTDNILIKAPQDSSGQVLIDLMVYNGPRYSMFTNIVPNHVPWKAPKIDTEKYPLPKTVSKADLKAIERVKNQLLQKINITDNGKGAADCQAAMKNIKELNIIEDSHGIRGVPLQVPRDHSRGEFFFYTYNGIPENQLDTYNDRILKGARRNRWARGILTKTSRAVSRGISKSRYDELSRASVKLWKFILDQGFNTSYGYGNYYSGTYMNTAAGIYAVREAIVANGLMDEVFEYAQYKNYPLFTTGNHIRSMDNFNSADSLFYLVFLYSNKVKAQIQALRALKDRLDSDITGDYGPCGFKPDGAGYHCTNFSVDYMSHGIRGIAKVAKAVSGSSFALSDKAFNVLKRVALRMYFYSSNCDVPVFMQGTNPFVRGYRGKYKLKYLPETLKNLALAGKGGCDKALAQAYVNLTPGDTAFAQKYKLKTSQAAQGNISMPYGPLAAQRRDGWVAVAWGGGIDQRGRGNYYMYHSGNGPLAIMGKGGFFASGNQEAGWDWNRTNGATVLYMPDITGIKYIGSGRKVPKGKEYLKKLMRRQIWGNKDDPVIKRGDGGISWRGVNGCFRKIFRGDKLYNDFSGIKSYFFINDRIYALGSNIKSDNKKYHVQTNLYQKALFKTVKTGRRKWGKSKLSKDEKATYVDGKKITAFPVANKKLNEGKDHHLIDPQGNGYFVPAGQKLFVARKTQKSKDYKGKKETSGDFATAWIDHGIASRNAKYAYVIMPYCDKTKFAKFSSKDFAILQQDDFAHILHDKLTGFYAGIFFKGGAVSQLPHVVNVQRDCQIMYKENNGKLEIAVGDPDPHRDSSEKIFYGHYGGKSKLVPLKVSFKGKWKLANPVDGVKIVSSSKTATVMEFASIHGKDFNFTLVK